MSSVKIAMATPVAVESAIAMARNEIRFRARLLTDFAPVPPVLANEGFELACRVGAIAKCVEMGLRPWREAQPEVPDWVIA